MKMLAFAIVIFTILGPFSVSGMDRMTKGFPDLPKDARAVAERYMACQHFSGEFNGTGDERDKEVTKTLRELKCDRVEQDLERIKKKYERSPRVLEILKEADFLAAA
ncbi:MAG: hypothetical protein EON58_17910 [Alphaproteobacteria bacterium]|nr:MAG: hypothetical protein EON58_17910 [Alphaproteobacteria bacterium]